MPLSKVWGDELVAMCHGAAPIKLMQGKGVLVVIDSMSHIIARQWSVGFDDAFFQRNKTRAVGYILAVAEATSEVAEHGAAGLDKVMGKWGS